MNLDFSPKNINQVKEDILTTLKKLSPPDPTRMYSVEEIWEEMGIEKNGEKQGVFFIAMSKLEQEGLVVTLSNQEIRGLGMDPKSGGNFYCLKQVISSNKCLCPKGCDCQNPPPESGYEEDKVYHVSNECPEHNLYPDPNPDCPLHSRGI